VDAIPAARAVARSASVTVERLAKLVAARPVIVAVATAVCWAVDTTVAACSAMALRKPAATIVKTAGVKVDAAADVPAAASMDAAWVDFCAAIAALVAARCTLTQCETIRMAA
jgi:hypothetical protein